MARAAHPDAMAPSRPGSTRTAPPRPPDAMPFRGNYRFHTLFGISGVLYLLMGLLVLVATWGLGSGEKAWAGILASFASPVMIAVHLVCLAALLFVGVRLFALFAKAQPPRLGPAKPPPGPVIHAALYAAWIGVTVVFAAILAGGLL